MNNIWPTDNLDSWRRIQPFISEFPDNEDWREWKRIAKLIVDSVGNDDIKSAFRVGQSMSHIILSTLDHHRLTDEPRVTLEIHAPKNEVRIAYGTANLWFFEATEEKTVSVANAPNEIRMFLKKLWCATKNGMPLPNTLK